MRCLRTRISRVLFYSFLVLMNSTKLRSCCILSTNDARRPRVTQNYLTWQGWHRRTINLMVLVIWNLNTWWYPSLWCWVLYSGDIEPVINRCMWTRLCVAMADHTIPPSHGGIMMMIFYNFISLYIFTFLLAFFLYFYIFIYFYFQTPFLAHSTPIMQIQTCPIYKIISYISLSNQCRPNVSIFLRIYFFVSKRTQFKTFIEKVIWHLAKESKQILFKLIRYILWGWQ